jgi:hypothetical protein
MGPIWSRIDELPGPPLNANVTGRAAGSAPGAAYAIEKNFASVCSPCPAAASSPPSRRGGIATEGKSATAADRTG